MVSTAAAAGAAGAAGGDRCCHLQRMRGRRTQQQSSDPTGTAAAYAGAAISTRLRTPAGKVSCLAGAGRRVQPALSMTARAAWLQRSGGLGGQACRELLLQQQGGLRG